MKKILEILSERFSERMAAWIGVIVLAIFASLIAFVPPAQSLFVPFLVACVLWGVICFGMTWKRREQKKKRCNIINKIDSRLTLSEPVSHRDFIRRLRTELLEFFKTQPHMLDRIEQIYNEIDKTGITEEQILLELRYCLDDTTNIDKSEVFSRPDIIIEDKNRR